VRPLPVVLRDKPIEPRLLLQDVGRRRRESMALSHRVPTDAAALRLALQPGITGTTHRIGGTEFNAGAGLFFTKSIASLSRTSS
jgi:hypothetical protein